MCPETKTVVNIRINSYKPIVLTGIQFISYWLLTYLLLKAKENGCISKMYFSYWKPPEVSERMWSVNLDGSISGEYQTLGGHSCRPSE